MNYKNVKINYSSVGIGEPLVLLHGFLHSTKMWNDYIDFWKKDYNVVAIDLPGHGKSGTVNDISIAEMAEIVNLVIIKEKLESVTIIGHSMGGYTGLAFAELFPKKLKKLILLHSSAFADSEAVKKKRALSIKILERHPSMFVRSTIEFLYSKENLEKHKDIIEQDILESKKNSFEGYIEATKAMKNRADRSFIYNTNIPIYILAGVFDKVIDKEVSQQQFDMLKNGRGVFLENASHMGFVEDKENCFKILNEFLKEL